MTDDTIIPGGEPLSPSPNLEIPMEGDSHSNEQVTDGELNEAPIEIDGEITQFDGQNGVPEEREEFVAPGVEMEFESYDDAYNYYSGYAKEVGFCVRVTNSWFKRNSREKADSIRSSLEMKRKELLTLEEKAVLEKEFS